MIVEIGKIAALILAVLGYGMLYKRSRLPVCFFPVTLIAGVVCFLYGFGFFGALKIGSYLVLLGGLVSLIVCWRPSDLRALVTDKSILFSAFAMVWLFALTRGATLSYWDDGSHWYRVCKSIFYENGFPTTPDIIYYDYVPGCQLWVSFILRFCDFSIPNCLFAQGMINIACVAVLFAGMENMQGRMEKSFSIAIICAAGVALCCMSVGTYVLLVDLQLGLVSMALLVFMLDQGKRREAAVPMALLFTFLILIKNSGVFFAAAILLWALLRNQYSKKGTAARLVCWAGIPAAVRWLYAIRVGIVYQQAPAAPQSMSIERFKTMLAMKDAGVMKTFTERFLYKLIIGDTGLSAAVYISLFLLIFLWYCLRQEGKTESARQLRQCLIGCICMLAAYVVSLYLTYLLTMNDNETLSVNSFYRYYGSMVIVLAGAAVYTAMTQTALARLGEKGHARVYVMGMLLLAVLAMPGAYSKKYIWGADRFEMPDYYDTRLWYTMEYHIPQNKYYSEESYVVLWDKDDYEGMMLNNEGAAYSVGAWVRADHIEAISKEDLGGGLTEAQIAALENCDYLVFVSDMTQESELLSQYLEETDYSLGMRSRTSASQ